MGSDSSTIVWFRRDLRIEGNPALAAAAKDGYVLPVFIWCPKEEGEFYPGRASRWWLKQSLAHLGESLKSLGAELTLMKAESTLGALLECVRVTGATKVVFNHLYDPVSLVRDHSIKKELLEHNVMVQSYNGDLLFEPWEVYDKNGKPLQHSLITGINASACKWNLAHLICHGAWCQLQLQDMLASARLRNWG